MKRQFSSKRASNFDKFKQNRHRVQTDAERRAERAAKYGRYSPGERSAFHASNREFVQKSDKSIW